MIVTGWSVGRGVWQEGWSVVITEPGDRCTAVKLSRLDLEPLDWRNRLQMDGRRRDGTKPPLRGGTGLDGTDRTRRDRWNVAGRDRTDWDRTG